MKRSVISFVTILVILSVVTQSFAQKGGVSKGQLSNIKASATEETRFGAVNAYSDGHGVWLSWSMDVELGNNGFEIYRIGKSGPELVNDDMVRGSARTTRKLPFYGETYSYFDANRSEERRVGKECRYREHDVD